MEKIFKEAPHKCKDMNSVLSFDMLLQNLYRLLIAIFLCCNFISITRWKQTNTFTKSDHQNISINVDIVAKALPRNQFYSTWNLIFDTKQEITVKDVLVNGTAADFSFNDSNLEVNIGKLFNEGRAEIKVRYELKYDEASRKVNFVKRDFVTVPEFVRGAEVKLLVKIPQDFTVYSNLNFLKKNRDGSLAWKGVLQNQINEDLGICRKQATWDVNTIITLFSEQNVKDLQLTTNLIYTGGNNEVQDFFVTCNNKKIPYKITDENIVVKHRGTGSSFQKYQLHGRLKNHCGPYVLDESLALGDENFEDDMVDFAAVAKKIVEEDKTKDPEYVKVCRWVHDFVKYDLTMAGKNLSPESVYVKRRGVCEHFATLFNRLMQGLKIPCYVVSGVAYSFKDKNFIPHAWNVVFVNNKWIPLDPTWNISSGIVPISHIFSKIDFDENHGIKAKVNCKSTQQPNNITMNIRQQAKFVNEKRN